MQINISEYWLSKITNPQVCSRNAVSENGNFTNFKTLFSEAEILALNLIPITKINQPIAVFLPKSVSLIIADMAIIYSGNAYNNLDIKQPPERTRLIIEHIQPTLILTTKALSENLKSIGIATEKIFCLDEISVVESNFEAILERINQIVDTDPCCIINTSGSTGVPKSVIMNHRSIIDFMDQVIDVFDLNENEIIGSLSPAYFDIFTLEFNLMLARQALFVIIPDNASAFPERLVEFLEKNKINFIFWVPTIMVNISKMDILSEHSMLKLKKILFAGEVFPIKHLQYWMENIPQATFVNMYGPIEITVDCLYHIVTKKDIEKGEVPIGKTFKNTKMLILNDENKECAINETGELCIGGSSLAMGYYNDYDKTAKAFMQNPLNKNYPEIIYRTGDTVYKREDGNIIFIGRKDFQVKHLGYRIELPEIEYIALTLDFIDNAAVLYDHNNKKIILVYESATDVEISTIRREMGRILPKYMLPTVYQRLDTMPRNPNGKIDRTKLKEMFVTE